MATKEKNKKIEAKTMRDTLRSLSAGMSIDITVDRPRQIASVAGAAAFLNMYEPELGVKFSCNSFPAENRVRVTAIKRN